MYQIGLDVAAHREQVVDGPAGGPSPKTESDGETALDVDGLGGPLEEPFDFALTPGVLTP